MYAIGVTILDSDNAQTARDRIVELEGKLELVEIRQQDLQADSPTNSVVGKYYKFAESNKDYRCCFYFLFHPNVSKSNLEIIWGDELAGEAPQWSCRRKYLGAKFSSWGRTEMEAFLENWMFRDGMEKVFVATPSTTIPEKILRLFS